MRGINVGGRAKLPMRELVRCMAEAGCADVRTYIQSGNLVFTHDAAPAAISERIGAAIEAGHGFRPDLLLLAPDELAGIMSANPFPEAATAPRSLHAFVMGQPPPAPDLAALERLKAPTERLALIGRILYLHAPDGIGRSKLAAQAERALGVPATARNWRTITAVAALAGIVD
jgi:uncharacterized protein (DUF1697 family)